MVWDQQKLNVEIKYKYALEKRRNNLSMQKLKDMIMMNLSNSNI